MTANTMDDEMRGCEDVGSSRHKKSSSMNRGKSKGLLLNLVAAAAASGAASPLHASLDESAAAPPPSADGGHPLHRRRRWRAAVPQPSASKARPADGSGEDRILRYEMNLRRRRRRRRTPETTAGKSRESRSRFRTSSSSSPFDSSVFVPHDPSSQSPLPEGLLPHIPPASANGGDDGPASSATAAIPISPRIINGVPTTPNRFPYASSLLDTATMSHICGGTLVAPDVVLTAGHCSGFFDSIQVGRYDIVNGLPGTYDHLIVEEHASHPNYGNVIMQDFALAKLYGTSVVPPVRINNRRNVPQVGDPLTVTGWGVTEEGNSGTASDVLRGVDVLSMTNENCEGSQGVYEGEEVSYAGYIVDNMMCAWAAGVDACQGDSGGPLIKAGNATAQDVQVGIVSWGLGCALGSFPGVYARISSEYDWISSSICEMSADPPSYLGCSEDDLPILVDWTRIENLSEVTVAVEVDDSPGDVSWVVEEDPELKAKIASAGRTAQVHGTSHVPFDTYGQEWMIEAHTLELTPGEQYRLTLLDRGTNGLKPREGLQQRQSRFRMCRGAVDGNDCIDAPLNSDVVICAGDGNFDLAKSLSCFVDPGDTPAPTPEPLDLLMASNRPPTFAPWEVPLLMGYGDDDRLRPSPRPTKSPSASPVTPRPSRIPTTAEPTRDGTNPPTKVVPTAFLAGTSYQTTFGAKSSKLPTLSPTSLSPTLNKVSNDVMIELELMTGDVNETEATPPSSSVGNFGTTPSIRLTILAFSLSLLR